MLAYISLFQVLLSLSVVKSVIMVSLVLVNGDIKVTWQNMQGTRQPVNLKKLDVIFNIEMKVRRKFEIKFNLKQNSLNRITVASNSILFCT